MQAERKLRTEHISTMNMHWHMRGEITRGLPHINQQKEKRWQESGAQMPERRYCQVIVVTLPEEQDPVRRNKQLQAKGKSLVILLSYCYCCDNRY